MLENGFDDQQGRRARKKPVMANNCCFAEHLRRMGLDNPQGLREELYQRLMLAGLQATS